jgi:hypothetical protein
VLGVYLYRQSKFNADIAQDNRTVTVDGNNEQQIHEGPKEFKRKEQFTAEVDALMIPVEDITTISSKAELKKAVQADVKSHVTPVYALSENCCDRCSAKITSCCRKTRDCLCCRSQKQTKIASYVEKNTIIVDPDPNKFESYEEEHLPLPEVKEDCCTSCCNKFRCWCCRKKKLVDLIKRTNTAGEQEAQRVVTMTIKYSKYSHPNSASNARLLSKEQQEAYYFRRFEPDTQLKFYLVNSSNFDATGFDLTRKVADDFCLTVTHLKAMQNRYPSEEQLVTILRQTHVATVGNEFIEPALQLPVESKTAPMIQEQRERPAIEKQPTTIVELNEN